MRDRYDGFTAWVCFLLTIGALFVAQASTAMSPEPQQAASAESEQSIESSAEGGDNSTVSEATLSKQVQEINQSLKALNAGQANTFQSLKSIEEYTQETHNTVVNQGISRNRRALEQDRMAFYHEHRTAIWGAMLCLFIGALLLPTFSVTGVPDVVFFLAGVACIAAAPLIVLATYLMGGS